MTTGLGQQNSYADRRRQIGPPGPVEWAHHPRAAPRPLFDDRAAQRGRQGGFDRNDVKDDAWENSGTCGIGDALSPIRKSRAPARLSRRPRHYRWRKARAASYRPARRSAPGARPPWPPGRRRGIGSVRSPRLSGSRNMWVMVMRSGGRRYSAAGRGMRILAFLRTRFAASFATSLVLKIFS